MTYYVKLGKYFFIQLFWLIYSSIWVYKGYKFIYWDLIFATFAVIVIPKILSAVYLKLFKKPAITVNEDYIFDHYKIMKYYWEDIDEVIASDAMLDIRLKEPQKYFKKIKNPFRIIFILLKYKVFKNQSLFTIDVQLLDIEKGKNKAFLDKLDELSIPLS
jgi:hypothetical protein